MFTILSLIALTTLGSPAQAQTLTKFPPDIVMECRRADNGEITARCHMHCHSIPRPADNAISTWPAIAWIFERLEFFSKAGRESENWLVAVRGMPEGGAWYDIRTFFLTLGKSHLCSYVGSEPTSGGAPAVDVRLVKYY